MNAAANCPCAKTINLAQAGTGDVPVHDYLRVK